MRCTILVYTTTIIVRSSCCRSNNNIMLPFYVPGTWQYVFTAVLYTSYTSSSIRMIVRTSIRIVIDYSYEFDTRHLLHSPRTSIYLVGCDKIIGRVSPTAVFTAVGCCCNPALPRTTPTNEWMCVVLFAMWVGFGICATSELRSEAPPLWWWLLICFRGHHTILRDYHTNTQTHTHVPRAWRFGSNL